MPWLYDDHERFTINRRLFLEILEQQEILEQALQVLDPGRKHSISEDEKIAAFKAVNSRTTSLNHFLRRQYGLLPVTARPPPTDPIYAVQVFQTPELIEQVLLYLGPQSVCQAAQACRAMADALSISSKLKRKLSIIADTDCFTHSVFDNYDPSDLHCRLQHQMSIYASALPATPGTYGEMLFRFTPRNLPRLGVRPRSVFICQPPITEIHAYIDSCDCAVYDNYGKRNPCSTIQDSDGITYGHLVDEARKLRKDHFRRPVYAGQGRSLDDESFPSLTFAARVPLQADHPLLCTPRSPC